MKPNFRPPFKNRDGAALVTVLAIVTILAVLLVSYLSLTQLDRKSSAAYSETIRVDELAQSALQQVISGLQEEIDAGSSADNRYLVNGTRIFQPSSNRTQVPARLGYSAQDYGTDVDLSGSKLPPSLLQVSRAGALYSPDYLSSKRPAQLASAVSTNVPSHNGRRITPARWNKPQFMGTDVALPFANQPPDWIYVTRMGSRVCTDAEVGTLQPDAGGANVNAVLGRFAYVIYDQGSLLDVNVAGIPQAAAAAAAGPVAGKSYASYADLTMIPGFAQPAIDNLANWRNKGGSALYTPWTAFVSRAATAGFLQAWPGDNPLLGRQDLLDYLAQNNAGNAAPFLTGFSRASNMPSASPVRPAGAASTTPDYAALADTNGTANRNLANVRAPSNLAIKHYDDQGVESTYRVNQGDSLLQTRFSLAKLAWITRHGNAAGISDAAIRAGFGLRWDDSNKRWDYVETANPMPSPNAIKTLDVVAAEGREPNFFELLKACILSGSLGRDPGAKSASTAATFVNDGVMGFGFESASSVKDAQIFRIGANMIDQADADSYPTAVYCPIFSNLNPADVVNTFVGIENLPYLHRLHQVVMATAPGSYTAGINGRIGAWLQPELWNPHAPPSVVVTERPSRFRVRTYGMAMTDWWQWPSTGGRLGSYGSGTNIMDYEGADAASGIIYFNDSGGSASAYSSNPAALTTSLADTAATNADCLFDASGGEYPHITSRSNPFAGIYSGESSAAYTPKFDNSASIWARTLPVAEISVILEYDASGNGDWRPYCQMLRLQSSVSASFRANLAPETQIVSISPAKLFFVHADSRTDRFSTSADWPNAANNNFGPNKTIWESGAASGAHSIAWFVPRATAGFAYAAGAQRYLGDWQINTSTARGYYADPDGIVRPADGFRGDNTSGDGRQTYHGGASNPRRPVILDRPFRSVGELGYAFRDQPFKTLDFWSDKSADAALLDVFTLTDEPRVTAGLVALNNAPQTIIQSILQGAAKNAADDASGNLIDAAAAKNLAAAIAFDLRSQPLLNRAELATRLGVTVQGALSVGAEKANKAYAETPLRALAAVTDTRTWNLCIDLIAQSGRIPRNARNLGQFLVEGEKRYWLHLAIDRFTGRIVDQQLEPVYE